MQSDIALVFPDSREDLILESNYIPRIGELVATGTNNPDWKVGDIIWRLFPSGKGISSRVVTRAVVFLMPLKPESEM